MTRYNSFGKFTIASKPVTVDYIHTGVFVPVFTFDEGYESVTFTPFGNTATRLQYWDENAYVSELVLQAPEEAAANGADSQPMSVADEAALAAQKEGLVATGAEAEAKAKKRKAEQKEALKQKKVLTSRCQMWSVAYGILGYPGASSILEQSPR